MVNGFGYKAIEFPVSEKHLTKIEKKNCISINVFCYENNLVYSVMYRMRNLKIVWIYWW